MFSGFTHLSAICQTPNRNHASNFYPNLKERWLRWADRVIQSIA